MTERARARKPLQHPKAPSSDRDVAEGPDVNFETDTYDDIKLEGQDFTVFLGCPYHAKD